MVNKALFILLAFFAYQGYGFEVIRLKDESVNLIRAESMGSPLTISHPFYDLLMSCHITYPNGRIFEAFPQNNLKDVNLFFDYKEQPLTLCSFGFKNAGSNFSGTYELRAEILNSVHQVFTLNKQRFHVNITED